MNGVPTSAHLAVHTLAVLISCSSFAHRPAVRRLALEVVHEPLTIAQHLSLRPLALGSSTVVTEVLTRACRRSAYVGTEELLVTALVCE